MTENCVICRKHAGLELVPPGGYIYEDEHWMVCHADVKWGPLGTLFIESRRHFLDYSEMTPEEAASLGGLLKRVYQVLREHTEAERIYQLSTMEGQPHLHMWIVPRRRDVTEKGLKFLSRDDTCEEADAIALVGKLRKSIKGR
ncbi:ATP adenylyltransferase [Anaerolineales bacterium]|nr:ATP adenylyltransferase [Anaerolineales bacterium]